MLSRTSQGSLKFLSGVRKSQVQAGSNGFRDAVSRMSFLSAHAYLDNSRLVLHHHAQSFAAKSPHPREFADPVMSLEGCGIDRHKSCDRGNLRRAVGKKGQGSGA